MKHLVIVESPTKARTIGRFLGDDFEIKPSMGHVMDLPKSKLGVDVDHNFTPQYEIVADKKKLISELKAAAKKADSIILATDPDREGEAISANIQELLLESDKRKMTPDKFKRIVFHEITEEAIKDALSHPRSVDEHLVDAQTARRVLDRLVGYQLSPLLWKKVRRGLSAGRVQSVALRLIVEREREIEKFAKEEYYTIHLLLNKTSQSVILASEKRARPESKKDAGQASMTKNLPVEFELIEIDGKKIEVQQKFSLYDGDYKISKTVIDSQEKAQQIVADMKVKSYQVADVVEREMKRSPQPPFTTSTLQQEASRRFGYSGKRTMTLAQKLYEEGFITYHRTDSVVLSQQAMQMIRSFIKKAYGEKYVPEKPRFYATKQKLAQEAHEAIRPTKMQVTQEAVQKDLGRDYARIYDIIFRRAVASQMPDAIIKLTTVYADSQGTRDKQHATDISATRYRAKASGSVLVFDGFLKMNPQALQDKELPLFKTDEELTATDIRADMHETPPPPRYNDASIIATLEEKGIGRPSTYASIISTLTDRTYVERIDKRFLPTPVGAAVNDFLVTNFSSIDDVPFTAQMEDSLDEIAQGNKNWVSMMSDFYKPFEAKIESVQGAERVKIQTEDTGEKCPECGQANLVIRTGRFGKFLSCARFPECKFTKPYVEETSLICPKDGGKVIVKKTRKGRTFYGCSNYPTCDFAVWKLEDIPGYQKAKSDESSSTKAPEDEQSGKREEKNDTTGQVANS